MSSLTSPSSTESEPFPFLPSWRSGSQRVDRSVMCWSPSWQSPSSASPRASHARDLLGWLRWGVFAVGGIFLGLTSWAGDQFALHGDSARAAWLCPWNRYVRTRVGYDAIIRGDVNTVLSVLATDPWSADLTFSAGLLYYARGDQENATRYLVRFIEIAPNSPMIQRVK